MRRAARHFGSLLIVAGLGCLAWAVLVWQWEDPFTAAYTSFEQRGLASELERKLETFTLPDGAASATAAGRQQGGGQGRPAGPAAEPTLGERRAAVREAARAYRTSLKRGEAVGRLSVPRLGIDMVFVNGTDQETLKKGPGRYGPLFLPGEGRLIYIAGHRTTYSAPFSRIERLRPGDRVVLELPYGTFEYRITHHRIVKATDVGVLRPGKKEVVALQACHPRFFASHRYIAYAEPVRVTPRGAAAYPV